MSFHNIHLKEAFDFARAQPHGMSLESVCQAEELVNALLENRFTLAREPVHNLDDAVKAAGIIEPPPSFFVPEEVNAAADRAVQEIHEDEALQTEIDGRRISATLQKAFGVSMKYRVFDPALTRLKRKALTQKEVQFPTELLLRAYKPDGEKILPYHAIKAATEMGIARQVDQTIIAAALTAHENNEDEIAINIAPATLTDPKFLDWLYGLKKTMPNANFSRVTFEITEEAPLDREALRSVLPRIRLLQLKHGFKISNDDITADMIGFRRVREAAPVAMRQKVDGPIVEDALKGDTLKLTQLVVLAMKMGQRLVLEWVPNAPAAMRLRKQFGQTIAGVQSFKLPQDRQAFTRECTDVIPRFFGPGGPSLAV